MAIQQISLNTDEMSNFQKWKKANGDDFSFWDYLSGVANVEVALAFTTLFWPDFVKHDGGIFLAEVFNQEIYEQWKAELGDDIAAIERVMNHQHIDDLLPGAESVGIDNLFSLGQVIKQMWENRLKSCYPDRTFQVFCNQDEYTVIVTFCQTLGHETSPAKPLDLKVERAGTMTKKTWTFSNAK
ncbi:MAG: hypothetical protein Fur006_17350 [Coleofasciculaceae cyanobacterium]